MEVGWGRMLAGESAAMERKYGRGVRRAAFRGQRICRLYGSGRGEQVGAFQVVTRLSIIDALRKVHYLTYLEVGTKLHCQAGTSSATFIQTAIYNMSFPATTNHTVVV